MPKKYSKTKAPLVSTVMGNLTDAHAQRVEAWVQDYMRSNGVILQYSRETQVEAICTLIIDAFSALNLRMLSGQPVEDAHTRLVKLLGVLTNIKDPEVLVHTFCSDVTGTTLRELGGIR